MPRNGYASLSHAARQMLWHYARGEMYTWLNQDNGKLGWIRSTHRGVQMMDAMHIGHTVKKILNQQKFEFRYNTAFDQVVKECGDLSHRGKTWITPQLAACYAELNRNRYAYSCEAWQGNELVGGVFGVQIGAFVSIDSMFHRATNAGKAVYGYHMLHLQKCGFHMIDVNYASEHCKRFGAVWMPDWEFAQIMRPLLHARIAMFEDNAAPALPWHVLTELRAARLLDKLGHRFARFLPTRSEPLPMPVEAAQAA